MTEPHRATIRVTPGGGITGRMTVPGDKSISHRALMLGAIAEGETIIHGFLPAEDTLATASAFRRMGVKIEHDGGKVRISGAGLNGLSASNAPIDLGNSGTAARLMAGLMSAQSFDSELTGDESLMSRPMLRIIEPLRLMQADIRCSEQGTLPIKITGGGRLNPINYRLPVASAQLKSCLLLAALYADGVTTLTENQATRDHTERMLGAFSHSVTINKHQISIAKADRLIGTEIYVPADFSAAAFFIVAATIAPGSDVVIENVGINPTRNAMLSIMQAMGANIALENARQQSGEPVADIHVATSKLHGIDIPQALVPVAIDEFPIILVAAACATGTTRLSGAAELRVKESDRLQAMLHGFTDTGIRASVTEDGMVVEGGGFSGGTVNSFSDHRIAMAFAVAGMVADDAIVITDCENIATSFPGFVESAQRAGMNAYYA